MQGRFASQALKIGVDGDAWNPREPVAGENQGIRVAILSRHPRVDKDVLQLARSSSARRPHPQPGLAESEPDVEAGPQVSHTQIVASVAGLDLELRGVAALHTRILHRIDLHEVAHDTKTPATR